jgi:NAD(P)-dependent dehydrogenase (short-subunit alcohol dehydrogenase family)
MTTNSSTKVTKPAGSTAIAGRTVLVTGANRGLGQALVEEALRRGAARVDAGVANELERQNAALLAADPIAA